MTEGIGCMNFLCRDIRFYVATRNCHNKGSAVGTKLAKERRNYVATEKFYVETKLAIVERNSIMTEDFWVAIELATTYIFVAQDRVRRAKVGAHDSALSHCVKINEAMPS